jgi:hypothetical protein
MPLIVPFLVQGLGMLEYSLYSAPASLKVGRSLVSSRSLDWLRPRRWNVIRPARVEAEQRLRW